MGDWKKHHANESEKALKHPLVKDVMEELAGNLGIRGQALPEYGIAKVAAYAASVARAQALGFDPDLLRLSPEEANSELLALAERAARSGVPVWALGKRL